MKSYTDSEQSKNLAKFLPLSSADMFFDGFGRLPQGYAYTLIHPNSFNYDRPCWSLSALLSVLPFIDFTTPQLIGTPKTLYVCKYNDDLISHAHDNPVDACVEMILKLHEQNLL